MISSAIRSETLDHFKNLHFQNLRHWYIDDHINLFHGLRHGAVDNDSLLGTGLRDLMTMCSTIGFERRTWEKTCATELRNWHIDDRATSTLCSVVFSPRRASFCAATLSSSSLWYWVLTALAFFSPREESCLNSTRVIATVFLM